MPTFFTEVDSTLLFSGGNVNLTWVELCFSAYFASILKIYFLIPQHAMFWLLNDKICCFYLSSHLQSLMFVLHHWGFMCLCILIIKCTFLFFPTGYTIIKFMYKKNAGKTLNLFPNGNWGLIHSFTSLLYPASRDRHFLALDKT